MTTGGATVERETVLFKVILEAGAVHSEMYECLNCGAVGAADTDNLFNRAGFLEHVETAHHCGVVKGVLETRPVPPAPEPAPKRVVVRKAVSTVGGKPSKGTPADKRLRENKPGGSGPGKVPTGDGSFTGTPVKPGKPTGTPAKPKGTRPGNSKPPGAL